MVFNSLKTRLFFEPAKIICRTLTGDSQLTWKLASSRSPKSTLTYATSSNPPSAWAHPHAEMLRADSRHHAIHDRQIVRRQVPDDVGVALEQAQVNADAVDVVQVAQVTCLDAGLICRTALLNR